MLNLRGKVEGSNICEVIQFHSVPFSKKVEKNSLERSHQGKSHIFSFGYLQILFDYLLELRLFGY
jgi:hypothetical protein